MNVKQLQKFCRDLPGANERQLDDPYNILVYSLDKTNFAYFKTRAPERWPHRQTQVLAGLRSRFWPESGASAGVRRFFEVPLRLSVRHLHFVARCVRSPAAGLNFRHPNATFGTLTTD